MIDELRLNTKLIGFDGVIGRRDYFLNFVYLCIISGILTFPVMFYQMTNAESFFDTILCYNLFKSAPVWLKIWMIPTTAFIAYIGISNIIRRLNDIGGKVNKELNITLCSVYTLGAFCMLIPSLAALFLLSSFNFILGCVLLFTPGNITAEFPKDFRKNFNWGAFWGTWIWGLFNKSYKTLWMLLLGWTHLGFYYALVCGLKGNEWAYKNRKWQSDEDFRSSQETQNMVFTLIFVFAIPVLYFLIIMAIMWGLVFTSLDEAKKSPDHKSPTLEKMDKMVNSFGSLYFEGHTITPEENKFYVVPKEWSRCTFKEKKDMLDLAANIAVSEKNKKNPKLHTSKATELSRTKIYSSTNGELLGEFVMDESVYTSEKPNFKEIVASAVKAYRFNNPTVK